MKFLIVSIIYILFINYVFSQHVANPLLTNSDSDIKVSNFIYN